MEGERDEREIGREGGRERGREGGREGGRVCPRSLKLYLCCIYMT